MSSELEDRGFTILEGVLPAALLSRAAALLEDRWPKPGGGRARIALRHLQDRAPELLSLLSPSLAAIARPILGEGARVVRALAFDKRAGANWAVTWHQDRSIALAEARAHPDLTAPGLKEGVPHALAPAAWLERILTLRLHLDPCEAETGALALVPGSHRHGILSPEASSRLVADGARVAAARAGDVLLMRPLTLHASSPLRGPGRRRVLHFECAPGPLPEPLRWYQPIALKPPGS